MTSLIVVDDHPILRAGVCAVVRKIADMRVVGLADAGRDGVKLAARLHPDIAIVDLMLPDLNGIEVIRRMLRVSPRTRVAILSMRADDPHLLRALHTGARAYLNKCAPVATFRVAFSEMLASRRYPSPPLTDRFIAWSLADIPSSTQVADSYDLLSDREREALGLLAQGLTYGEIGEHLQISPRRAESHRTRLIHKLGLERQNDLTLYAIQRGLIVPEQGLARIHARARR
jgi:two-component system response regulator NreC